MKALAVVAGVAVAFAVGVCWGAGITLRYLERKTHGGWCGGE